MKKLISIVLFSLIVGIVMISGCQTNTELIPTMTASEVCQHVNQRLKNEYQYLGSTQRYELSYTALSAIYENVVDERTDWMIEGLTPGALQIFREKLNTMSPQEKVVATYNLRGIKEVEDIVRELGVTWLVEVEISYELQSLKEGQWEFRGVSTAIEQYLLNEKTSILTKR